MAVNFKDVTETVGDYASKEQIQRLYNRYAWAAGYCKDKRVLEVACGTGQGLSVLAEKSAALSAGDICADMLNIARKNYQETNIDFKVFDGEEIPFPDKSFDVIICFEAIYYIKNVEKFLEECKRLLGQEGRVLITTANPDLFDFNPSPHSVCYYNLESLNRLFIKHGFSVNNYGDLFVDGVDIKQKILRPLKKIAVKLGLMPKTMRGKRLLKKLVFGGLVRIPEKLSIDYMKIAKRPTPIKNIGINREYKVILCDSVLKY